MQFDIIYLKETPSDLKKLRSRLDAVVLRDLIFSGDRIDIEAERGGILSTDYVTKLLCVIGCIYFPQRVLAEQNRASLEIFSDISSGECSNLALRLTHAYS